MMFAKFDPKNIPEYINCGTMKLGRCYVADVIDMDPIAEIRSYPGPVPIVHIIEGGVHGFGKKHDAIAIAHLRRFTGRNEK